MSQITVRGAKNLVTKAMVAALLGETPSELRDVPKISDVEVVQRLLELHGVKIEFSDDGVMKLDPTNVKSARMVDIDAHAGSLEFQFFSVVHYFTSWVKHSSQILVVATSVIDQLIST
jgi:hypothetical protein